MVSQVPGKRFGQITLTLKMGPIGLIPKLENKEAWPPQTRPRDI